MTVTNTFDGVTLQKVSTPDGINYPFTLGISELETGGFGLQGSATYGFECTVKCYTSTYADITAFKNKIGTVGDLVLGSITYSNVMVKSLKEVPVFPAAASWFSPAKTDRV